MEKGEILVDMERQVVQYAVWEAVKDYVSHVPGLLPPLRGPPTSEMEAKSCPKTASHTTKKHCFHH